MASLCHWVTRHLADVTDKSLDVSKLVFDQVIEAVYSFLDTIHPSLTYIQSTALVFPVNRYFSSLYTYIYIYIYKSRAFSYRLSYRERVVISVIIADHGDGRSKAFIIDYNENEWQTVPCNTVVGVYILNM